MVMLSPVLVGQFLQGDLPQSATCAVAPAAVRSDEQLPRFGKAAAAHPLPPTANGVHGKGRRVVVDANAHPTLVVENVVDAVGNGLAQKGVAEVMHADLFRLALRTPIPASILEIPDQFLLFRIHRDRRLTTVEEPRHLGAEVLELRVSVGMRGPFARLAVALQAVPRLVEQGRHGAVAHRMRLPGQFLGQRARVLLIVHRSGDSGSPRDVGSTKPSSAGSNCGSFRIARRRPPPGRRMRSGGSAAFPRRGAFNSAIPARTVDGDMCVASATAVTPPQPISRASLAAHNRRDRSLSAP